MLSSLLHVSHPNSRSSTPEAEDIFTSSLGLIFTDDTRNQHGDPGAVITYRSRFGALRFQTADPEGEDERRRFAHYLWNAGIMMGELVGGRDGERGEGEGGRDGRYADWERWKGGGWWLGEEEERRWRVEGEKVLELGAGVGMGGIVSCLAGAEEVKITDYPAPTIVDTLVRNVAANVPPELKSRISVQGHQWGCLSTPFALENGNRFTRILAADCFWMPHEHDNLARSMLHFLSPNAESRIFVIAGFHTGRRNLAPFLVETVPANGLEVETIWEMDVGGERRVWQAARPEEPIGERKKWVVLALLKRSG